MKKNYTSLEHTIRKVSNRAPVESKSLSLEHTIRKVHEKTFYEDEDPNIDKVNQIANNLKKMTKKEVKLPNINDGGPDMFKPGAKSVVQEDFEYEMARNELRTAIDAAKRLLQNLEGEGEIEAWVQSKITKASDYLDTVADYMDSRDNKKLKEETENLLEAIGIVGSNGSKYKGGQFDNTRSSTLPLIGPGHSQSSKKISKQRQYQKEKSSLTLSNKINEGKKEEKEDGEKLDPNEKTPWVVGFKGSSYADTALKGLVKGYQYVTDPENLRKGLYNIGVTKDTKAPSTPEEIEISDKAGKDLNKLLQYTAPLMPGLKLPKLMPGLTLPKLKGPKTNIKPEPLKAAEPIKTPEKEIVQPKIEPYKVDTKLKEVPAAANDLKPPKIEQPSSVSRTKEVLDRQTGVQQMKPTTQEKPLVREPANVPEKKVDITQPKVNTTIDTGTQKLPGAEIKLPGRKKFADYTKKPPANVNAPKEKVEPVKAPKVEPTPSTPADKPAQAPVTAPAQAPVTALNLRGRSGFGTAVTAPAQAPVTALNLRGRSGFGTAVPKPAPAPVPAKPTNPPAPTFPRREPGRPVIRPGRTTPRPGPLEPVPFTPRPPKETPVVKPETTPSTPAKPAPAPPTPDKPAQAPPTPDKPAPPTPAKPAPAPPTPDKPAPPTPDKPAPPTPDKPAQAPVTAPNLRGRKGNKKPNRTRSKRRRFNFSLPSLGDGIPFSGSGHGHSNPTSISRAKMHTEENRKYIEATARPSNDKYRKNVGRFGKSELTRQSAIQKQIIDEQTKRRAKIVKDTVILKNPNPQPEGSGQNSQVDVKPKLNHKFDNSPE